GETAYAQGTPEDDEAREGRAEREPPEARALLPRRPPRRRGDPLRRARADAGSLRGGARQDPHEAARHGRAVRRDGARRGPGPRRGAGRGGPAGPRVRGRRLLRPLPRRQGIPVHAHPGPAAPPAEGRNPRGLRRGPAQSLPPGEAVPLDRDRRRFLRYLPRGRHGTRHLEPRESVRLRRVMARPAAGGNLGGGFLEGRVRVGRGAGVPPFLLPFPARPPTEPRVNGL